MIFPLAALCLALPALARELASRQRLPEYPYPEVIFTSGLPTEYLCADSDLALEWQGGSGKYTLVTVLNYTGLDATSPETLVFDSTETSHTVHIGPFSEYPEESTLLIAVRDSNNGGYADMEGHSYDTTDGYLPVVECSTYDV